MYKTSIFTYQLLQSQALDSRAITLGSFSSSSLLSYYHLCLDTAWVPPLYSSILGYSWVAMGKSFIAIFSNILFLFLLKSIDLNIFSGLPFSVSKCSFPLAFADFFWFLILSCGQRHTLSVRRACLLSCSVVR